MIDLAKELRVMHACEKGAIGVYRGHKCVARYFFRAKLEELDCMRFHEREHSEIFARLLREYGFRQCYLAFLWIYGGLFYGVFVGAFGLKAIGRSTATIEDIVDREFDNSLKQIQQWPAVCDIVRAIQIEEREHKASGELFAGDTIEAKSIIVNIARAGAYAAKHLAETL
ncbi:MAG: demethoxyubiquinone hydroxylase family protein [Pseudomonas sp.]|uniref:demethoxyubiquinone hydroxylase family protein n=1 Tax=Pseudomonas sp. TaxID=306 RepID=UPI002734FE8F|nr:demethoxyubiquinone hydroxylase family protein [Pseudomonas sp.]MDP3847171.1 demethoxyubiquinone hydroxylase family protein [Pseudomonas sp.]